MLNMEVMFIPLAVALHLAHINLFCDLTVIPVFGMLFLTAAMDGQGYSVVILLIDLQCFRIVALFILPEIFRALCGY